MIVKTKISCLGVLASYVHTYFISSTDACNIISKSIFTGISLQPLHYSIQRGENSFPQWPMAIWWNPTVSLSWQQPEHGVTYCIWSSIEPDILLVRGIRGHRSLTLFALFHWRRYIRPEGSAMTLLVPHPLTDWKNKIEMLIGQNKR